VLNKYICEGEVFVNRCHRVYGKPKNKHGGIMSKFEQFLKEGGIHNPGVLTSFITNLVSEPSLIYGLTESELGDIECMMDKALDMLCIELKHTPK
jgi:hypothetical protein